MKSRNGITLLVFVSGAMIGIMLQNIYSQWNENNRTFKEEQIAPVVDVPGPNIPATDIATVEPYQPNRSSQARSLQRKQKIVASDTTPSKEQQELYATLLSELTNPSYLHDITTDEFLRRMDPLEQSQKARLLANAREMVARGELKLEYFRKPEPLRHETVEEGAPLPTREEQAKFDQLADRLADQDYVDHITYVELVQEIQALPPALKQEVADRVNGMLKNGLIDPGSFLGPKYAGKTDIELFFN